MKVVAVIPARYASTRFPGKPLALICGKPMIQHVYERVRKAPQLDGVYVATDDMRIHDAVKAFQGKVLMTSPDHCSGTDRIAQCAGILALDGDDIVLNIQGDEPLIRPEMISELISCFENRDVLMGTLKKEIEDDRDLSDPNIVKVVTDLKGNAVYFSRSCIPYTRTDEEVKIYRHIGVYGYRKSFLMKFSSLKRGPLEKSESLEQLRAIENGYRIKVAETRFHTVGVDTPEQIKEVEKELTKVEYELS